MVQLTSIMKERSVFNKGNIYRLLKVFEKAGKGEPITFVTLGGSITQGAVTSKYENAYACRIYDWLKKSFPQSDIKFQNAGIGATGSIIALHRLEKDVLSYEPDFVIVEFSVNEGPCEAIRQAYDNLIHKIFNCDSQPAVLLLCMVASQGQTAQSVHGEVGKYYDLPIISYRDAIWAELENGTFSWNDISNDAIHPDDVGHGITADLVTSYLESIINLNSDDFTSPAYKDTLTENRFKNAKMYYGGDIEPRDFGCFKVETVNVNKMPTGWVARENGESMKFHFENCRRVYILFEKTNRGDGGKAEVITNGESQILDADFKDGWGIYSNTERLFDSDTPATVDIEIIPRLETGKMFDVVGIMVS